MPRYIDADALNAAIEKWFDGVCVYDVSPSEAANDFQSIVDEQPTISPDDVRGVGKWEDVSVHDNIRNIMIASMRCNVCKRYHNEVYHYGNPTEMARFCPVCGAKMEVSKDA